MTPEETREFDEMRGAAHLYHTSAVFLQDISPIIQDLSKGKLPVNLNANIITSIVVFALSAEVAIKAILKNEGTVVPRQHDLKTLFESMSETNRNVIKQNLERKYPEFDSLLENNKKTFVEWRYFYERAQSADVSFLRDLSHELNILCNNLASER